MNAWPFSSKHTQLSALPMAWLPVVCGIAVICFESTTTMSGANTGRWLLDLCHALWGQTDVAAIERANLLLRKVGHFCGYGTLGLLFARAWFITLQLSWQGARSRLPFSAAALGVFCTFCVASLDELHQRILPGRVSSIYDVGIDTAGAIVFVRAAMFLIERRRRTLLEDSIALSV